MAEAASGAPALPAGFSFDAELQARLAAAKRWLRWRRRLLPVLALFGILVLWQAIIVWFDVKPFIAPTPISVIKVLVSKWDLILVNLGTTAFELIMGFLIGNIAAAAVAMSFVYRRQLEEAFFPVALILNSVPVVAKAPILILILGHGMAPKIAIAALICFFPTLVNTTRGLKDVSREHLELMRILSASTGEVFWKLRVRNALPYFFAALKITASISVIGAIVGEWVGATSGIGNLLIQSTVHYETPTLYASVVAGSAFAALFFATVAWAERFMLRWRVEPDR